MDSRHIDTMIDLNENHLYEVNPLDADKSLFRYSQKLMNSKCGPSCFAFLESIKSNQPYNFEGLIIRAVGKSKHSEE